MTYSVIENFSGGIDRTRARYALDPGQLWDGKNGHITRGGDFEIRKEFVSKYALPANTFGFAATDDALYCFGSIVDPGMPSGVTYQRLRHPNNSAMTAILDVALFDGKIYAVAQYADGSIYHFYNGNQVGDFTDGIRQSWMTLTTWAEHMAELINAEASGQIASAAAGVITITAKENDTPFTCTTIGHFENDQTVNDYFTVTETQAAGPSQPEISTVNLDVRHLIGAAGSNGSTPNVVSKNAGGYSSALAEATPESDLYDVVWGGSQYVTMGFRVGGTAAIFTSPDGITWTYRTNSISNGLQRIIYNESLGLYIAGGPVGATGEQIWTSPDAITWTQRTIPSPTSGVIGALGGKTDVTGTLLVAFGGNSGSQVESWTSSDGITWTKNTTGTLPGGAADVRVIGAVLWNPPDANNNEGRWVAVGQNVNGLGVWTSTDGLNWTSAFDATALDRNGNPSAEAQFNDISYSATLGLWVIAGTVFKTAVGGLPYKGVIYTTTDPGDSSKYVSQTFDGQGDDDILIEASHWDGAQFSVGGRRSSRLFMMESTDGANWNQVFYDHFSSSSGVRVYGIASRSDTPIAATIVLDSNNIGRAGMPDAGSIIHTHERKMYSLNSSRLDFSSVDDATKWNSIDATDPGAGFIGIGTHQSGSSRGVGIGTYQDKLAILSKRTVQLWDMEADDDLNKPFQYINSIGARAAKSIKDYGALDLVFLAFQGIRSVRSRSGINLAGVQDIGTPIDSLVREWVESVGPALADAAIAEVEPEDNRLWMAIGKRIFVFSYFPAKKISAWTYYDLAVTPEAFAILNDRIYMRSGDTIYLYGGDNNNTYFSGNMGDVRVSLPFMGFGKDDTTKMLEGVDQAAKGSWSVKVLINPNATDEAEAILIGTLQGVTWTEERNMGLGETTMFAPVLESAGGEYTSISKAALIYALGDAKG